MKPIKPSAIPTLIEKKTDTIIAGASIERIASNISGIWTLSTILDLVIPLDGVTIVSSSRNITVPSFPKGPVTVQSDVAEKVSKLKILPGMPL
ncbi:hypothetical protein SDC9_183059 [bioreactor metagenome]|uniref:Uncharacterized protein n=1 Tax=bioreactor metagenome TaxID=1076179 RepID=A0A645H973_9ZZZZ